MWTDLEMQLAREIALQKSGNIRLNKNKQDLFISHECVILRDL